MPNKLTQKALCSCWEKKNICLLIIFWHLPIRNSAKIFQRTISGKWNFVFNPVVYWIAMFLSSFSAIKPIKYAPLQRVRLPLKRTFILLLSLLDREKGISTNTIMNSFDITRKIEILFYKRSRIITYACYRMNMLKRIQCQQFETSPIMYTL